MKITKKVESIFDKLQKESIKPEALKQIKGGGLLDFIKGAGNR